MSALPRPELPPGAAKALNDALHELHHRAGWPSLRTLARETGVSHTTVSKAFSQPTLPSWGTLQLLVEAMNGEAANFHDLWLAASAPISGGGPPPRIAGRRAELRRRTTPPRDRDGAAPRHRRGRHRQDQAGHHRRRVDRHVRRRRALPATVQRDSAAADRRLHPWSARARHPGVRRGSGRMSVVRDWVPRHARPRGRTRQRQFAVRRPRPVVQRVGLHTARRGRTATGRAPRRGHALVRSRDA